jgi:hypothetical protein
MPEVFVKPDIPGSKLTITGAPITRVPAAFNETVAIIGREAGRRPAPPRVPRL